MQPPIFYYLFPECQCIETARSGIQIKLLLTLTADKHKVLISGENRMNIKSYPTGKIALFIVLTGLLTSCAVKSDSLKNGNSTFTINDPKFEESAEDSKKPEDGLEYVQAKTIGDEAREKTLKMLFDRSISQLVEYSTYRITEATPAALLPILPAEDELSINAEHFYDHLLRSMSENRQLKNIKRKDPRTIIKKKKLSLADVVDGSSAPMVGKMLGAALLIVGKLYKKGDFFELFLKLLSVETGEVLSVVKANIDTDLGL